jgi:hypothetical protein
MLVEVVSDETPLSTRLEAWLLGPGKKTAGDLIETFGEQTFAVLFVVLLAVPALPVPTGGLTHVLEVIAMLLTLELVVGRRDVWLPERLRRRALPALGRPAFANRLVRRIRWFERFARPRGATVLALRVSTIGYGATIFVLALTAFLAPPFSGLDTLPALGAVVVSLGMLFRDAVVAAAGLAIGAAGIVIVIGLGHAITRLL